MKLTQLALAAVGSAALFTMTTAQAQVFADWTFQSDSVATNNSPIADTGIDGQTGNSTGTATSIGMTNTLTSPASTTADDVLLGVTGDTGANGVADLTNEWRVRSTGSGKGNGWDSAAAIATQGAQFFASTAGSTGSAITINFDWYSTTQGEANMECLYTTNGGSTWNNLQLTLAGSDTGAKVLTNSSSTNGLVVGSYVNDTTANTSGGQDWFTDLTATITDPNALNDSGFGIEMVNAATGTACLSTQGTALNNTSGNWRFDNVEIQATPEPSSWMLGLGAVALFLGLRRVVRRS